MAPALSHQPIQFNQGHSEGLQVRVHSAKALSTNSTGPLFSSSLRKSCQLGEKESTAQKCGHISGQGHSPTESYGMSVCAPAPIRQREESQGRIRASTTNPYNKLCCQLPSSALLPGTIYKKHTYLHSNPCFVLCFYETK